MTIETPAAPAAGIIPEGTTQTVTPPAPAADPVAVAPATPPAATPTEPVVPEAYELQMPEGIELDKVAADEFTAIAKDLKLDQPTAQKLADIAAKQQQRQVEAHAKMVEGWVEQVKADKELGGDKLQENLGIARAALDKFGSPELKAMLNDSGIGNHPAVIRAFFSIGKAISEDRIVTSTPAGNAVDPAKKMFPTMN